MRQRPWLDWRKIIVELLIVTVGVLVALALDQWMAERKERAEERLLLTAIRTEFQDILANMDAELVFRQAMNENVDKVYEMAVGESAPAPEVLDPMLGKLLWWSYVDFTIGGVQSVLLSGKLRIIENEQIRYFLAALPERIASIKQIEANDHLTLMQGSAPYFVKHGDISQILVTMTARPGSPEGGEPWIHYRPKLPHDHAPLLKEKEFLGIVGSVAASQSNVVEAYQEFRPELVRAIGLLDAELGDSP